MNYFEQTECWGGYRPRVINNKVRIKIIIKDVYKRNHSLVIFIPNVELSEARKFNPEFGNTIEALNKTDNGTAA